LPTVLILGGKALDEVLQDVQIQGVCKYVKGDIEGLPIGIARALDAAPEQKNQVSNIPILDGGNIPAGFSLETDHGSHCHAARELTAFIQNLLHTLVLVGIQVQLRLIDSDGAVIVEGHGIGCILSCRGGLLDGRDDELAGQIRRLVLGTLEEIQLDALPLRPGPKNLLESGFGLLVELEPIGLDLHGEAGDPLALIEGRGAVAATGFTATSFVSVLKVAVWLVQCPTALPATEQRRSLPFT